MPHYGVAPFDNEQSLSGANLIGNDDSGPNTFNDEIIGKPDGTVDIFPWVYFDTIAVFGRHSGI